MTAPLNLNAVALRRDPTKRVIVNKTPEGRWIFSGDIDGILRRWREDGGWSSTEGDETGLDLVPFTPAPVQPAPEDVEWGDWVPCSDTDVMVEATAGQLSEVRFDAEDHVMAYRLPKQPKVVKWWKCDHMPIGARGNNIPMIERAAADGLVAGASDALSFLTEMMDVSKNHAAGLIDINARSWILAAQKSLRDALAAYEARL